MFKFQDKNIYHTRGDTADFEVTIKKDGVVIDDPYTAVFSVKHSLHDKEYVFQILVEDGRVHIPHETTQNLPFDTYYYDIEIHIDDGTDEGRYATVGPYKYYLRPDVTTDDVIVTAS